MQTASLANGWDKPSIPTLPISSVPVSQAANPRDFAQEPVVHNPSQEMMRPAMRFSSASAYHYEQESVSLKYTSSDGDTLELTAQRESLQMSERVEFAAGDEEALNAVLGETEVGQTGLGKWEHLQEVMTQVKNEMQQQHLNLLKAMLGLDGKGGESGAQLQGLWQKLAAAHAGWPQGLEQGNPQGDQAGQAGQGLGAWGYAAYAMDVSVEKLSLSMELITNGDGRGLDALFGAKRTKGQEGTEQGEGVDGEEESGIPEYWNAENTSNRIVDFAMRFAALQNEDMADFISKIKDAVDLGFAQASQMTGPLSGNAEKLTQNTHQKVFDKLDRKLAEHEATLYNQGTDELELQSAT